MTNTIGSAAAIFALTLWSTAALAGGDMVSGEVRKIDADAGKITLRHGPIRNLGMDDASMTMVFRVQDVGLLKQVKVGDKVQFEAERTSAGITITTLQKTK